jgi:hypothetical protein
MPLSEFGHQLLTSPVTGAFILAALLFALVSKGWEELADRPSASAARVLDLRTVCLLVVFATAVAARFLTLFG